MAKTKIEKEAKVEPALEVVEKVSTRKPKAAAAKIDNKPSARVASTIKKFQSHDKDTGSTEVQVAVLSDKVNTLSEHLQTHKKDVDSRMGLLKMISQRRSLLGYLEKKNPERYKKLIGSLGLRK